MEELKVGDVVRLKSGSPLMTIENIDEEGITCVWFANDEVIRNYFTKEILQKVETSSDE